MSQGKTSPREIRTARLLLRQWLDEDREPFAALNADPEVMRYFPSTQTRETSDRGIDKCQQDLQERGWGLWAAERLESGEFVGFIGLSIPRHPLPFMPCVEVGYRLAKAFWGCGYATEGARAALDFGFYRLALEQIVSFTALINQPSRAVMERLGMINSGEDFDHPAIAEGSPIRRHCLYRLSRTRWEEQQKPAQLG